MGLGRNLYAACVLEPSGACPVIIVAVLVHSPTRKWSDILITFQRKRTLPNPPPPFFYLLCFCCTLYLPSCLPSIPQAARQTPHQDADKSTSRSPSALAWGSSCLGEKPVMFPDIVKESPDNDISLHLPPDNTL